MRAGWGDCVDDKQTGFAESTSEWFRLTEFLPFNTEFQATTEFLSMKRKSGRFLPMFGSRKFEVGARGLYNIIMKKQG